MQLDLRLLPRAALQVWAPPGVGEDKAVRETPEGEALQRLEQVVRMWTRRRHPPHAQLLLMQTARQRRELLRPIPTLLQLHDQPRKQMQRRLDHTQRATHQQLPAGQVTQILKEDLLDAMSKMEMLRGHLAADQSKVKGRTDSDLVQTPTAIGRLIV